MANGLGVGLSFAGPAIPQGEVDWARAQAARQAIIDAQTQRQAQQAFFQSLMTPDAAMLPQQAAPMPPSAAPAAAPSPLDQYGSQLSSAISPTQPTAPVQPATPPSGPGGQPNVSTPYGGFAFQDPMAQLRQVAMQLKRANPNASPQVLSAALQNYVKTFGGQNRQMMDAQLRLMQMDQNYQFHMQSEKNQANRLQLENEWRVDSNNQRMQIVGMQIQAAGNRQQAAIAARQGYQQAQQHFQWQLQQYRASQASFGREQQGQIRNALNKVTTAMHKYSADSAAGKGQDVLAADNQAVADAQSQVDSLLVGGSGQGGAGSSAAPAAPAAGTPADLPSAAAYPDGTRASKGGVTYVVQNRQWVKQ